MTSSRDLKGTRQEVNKFVELVNLRGFIQQRCVVAFDGFIAFARGV